MPRGLQGHEVWQLVPAPSRPASLGSIILLIVFVLIIIVFLIDSAGMVGKKIEGPRARSVRIRSLRD